MDAGTILFCRGADHVYANGDRHATVALLNSVNNAAQPGGKERLLSIFGSCPFIFAPFVDEIFDLVAKVEVLTTRFDLPRDDLYRSYDLKALLTIIHECKEMKDIFATMLQKHLSGSSSTSSSLLFSPSLSQSFLYDDFVKLCASWKIDSS